MLAEVREVLRIARRHGVDVALAYARLLLMKRRPASQIGRIQALGMTFHYGDFDLFLALFRETFVEQSYRIERPSEEPFILDAGGNIGVATMFLKRKYPSATVHVFEPDKRNFALLEKNIAVNLFTHVYAHNVALSDRAGPITLFARRDVAGGDIGVSVSKALRSNYHSEVELEEVSVYSELLSAYIDRPVDLLKMDVEGAEALILCDLDKTSTLSKIRQITMEYHRTPDGNPLSAVLATLERAGLRYEIGHWNTDARNNKIAHCIVRAFGVETS